MKKVYFSIILLIAFALGFGLSQISSNNRTISTHVNNDTCINNPTITPIPSPVLPDETEIEALPQQTYEFDKDEIKYLKLIKKYYPDFVYSKIYVYTSENHRKMVFKKNHSIGEYDACLEIYDYPGYVNYYFSEGTSYEGYGSYQVVDDHTVFKIEKGYGKTSFDYSIYKNGKRNKKIVGK